MEKKKVTSLSMRTLEKRALQLAVKREACNNTMSTIATIERGNTMENWANDRKDRYESACHEDFALREEQALIVAAFKLLQKINKG